MSQPKSIGLIGFPLVHSFSNRYFSDKIQSLQIKDLLHNNYEISQIEELPGILSENPGLIGLNVTVPHKQSVMSYLNRTEPPAEDIGAVNTIRIERRQQSVQLIGYNTDWMGFQSSLTDWLPEGHMKALVLGSGGASRAVRHALRSLNIPYQLISRNPEVGDLTYDKISSKMAEDHRLWVQCTPLGTYPDTQGLPNLPYDELTEDHYLYDLVYNPPITQFLRQGLFRGATCKNGWEMLVNQAEASWEIWFNCAEQPPTDPAC